MHGESVSRSGPVRLRTLGHLIDLHIADMHEVGKPLRRSGAYSLGLLKRCLDDIQSFNLDRPVLVDFGRERGSMHGRRRDFVHEN